MATELEEETGSEIVQGSQRKAQSFRIFPPLTDTSDLEAVKKRQLLELLASLLRRGRITPEEVVGAVRQARPSGSRAPGKTSHAPAGDLKSELQFERAANAFLDDEVTRLKAALADEHELVKERLYRTAAQERQLEEAREITERLVVASRDSLRTLRRLKNNVEDEGCQRYVLEPLGQDLCQVARVVEELHALARKRDDSPSTDVENP